MFLCLYPIVVVHPLELFHSCAEGPTPMRSSNGHKYFVVFIIDNSLFTWLFALQSKSDVCFVFIKFQKLVEKHFQTPFKVV